MGPHPLWLLETLCARRAPSPGNVVLDLGCGKALTTVFLAREYDVRVVAVDWWISPGENWKRLVAAGVASMAAPLRGEAHHLPLPDGQFDVIISIDAYHYFGTADLYLAEMARLIRPGGWLGIVVPGLRQELSAFPPPQLSRYWDWDFCSFHSPEWWARHWTKTGLLAVQDAWWLQDGHDVWLNWAQIVDDHARSKGLPAHEREAALLRADHDRLLGFTLAIAAKPS
jgi:cyclopropane fatty-acyl-phospholipid synthase-like methyltransferase